MLLTGQFAETVYSFAISVSSLPEVEQWILGCIKEVQLANCSDNVASLFRHCFHT